MTSSGCNTNKLRVIASALARKPATSLPPLDDGTVDSTTTGSEVDEAGSARFPDSSAPCVQDPTNNPSAPIQMGVCAACSASIELLAFPTIVACISPQSNGRSGSGQPPSLEVAHRFSPPSTANPSISLSSASLNSRWSSAPRLSSICDQRLAPMTADVTLWVAENPGQRHLSQGLSALLSYRVQSTNIGQILLAQNRWAKRVVLSLRGTSPVSLPGTCWSTSPAPMVRTRCSRCLRSPGCPAARPRSSG